MLLLEVPKHVYDRLYSSNPCSFFGFVLYVLSIIIYYCYVVDLKFVYCVTLVGSWSFLNFFQV